MNFLWDFLTRHYQIITSIAGVVVALCALGLTLWQLSVAQRHNRLSVRPHLTTWRTIQLDPFSVIVTITNNGLGPALIEEFKFTSPNGKPLEGKPEEQLADALYLFFSDYEDTVAIETAHMYADLSVAVGEERVLLKLDIIGDEVPTDAFIDEQISKVKLNIKYKSFYGEVFNYSSVKDGVA